MIIYKIFREIILNKPCFVVTSLCAGLRARSVVSGSWDCTVKIWTISPLNEVSDVTLRGHEAAVWSVCTTKEEKFVSAAADKNIDYTPCDIETLYVYNPAKYIVISHSRNESYSFIARPEMADIEAVINEQIYQVDDALLTRPGPRSFIGLVQLAKTIHPEETKCLEKK